LRIYLAGKIASVDWRHLIVRGLKERLEGLDLSQGWPVMDGSIYTIHSYTGPYFKKIDKTAADPDAAPVKVHRLCLKAIDDSDLVYAWVDDPTCYATIYEMGYAHAKGKYTVVAYPPTFDKSELWFMSACSDEIIEAASPEMGLLGATMRALHSGKVQNLAVEYERVQKNLARLQHAVPGKPLEAHQPKLLSRSVEDDFDEEEPDTRNENIPKGGMK